MEFLLKVGDSRTQSDDLYLKTRRSGHVLSVADDGHQWGTLERKHHAVIRVPMTMKFDEFVKTELFDRLCRFHDMNDKNAKELKASEPEQFTLYRYRQFFIDFKRLENSGLITPSKYNDIYNRDVDTGIIELATSLDLIALDETVHSPLEIKKNMAVASGTYDVGSGLDYSTWAGALGDIDSGGLTGNLTFQQNDESITETTNHNITENPNGYNLLCTCQSGDQHDGTWGNGARISLGSSGYLCPFHINVSSPTGVIVVEKLACDLTTGDGNFLCRCYGLSSPAELFFRYNIIKSSGGSGNQAAFFGYYHPTNFRAYNNIIWGIAGSGSLNGGITIDNEYGTPGGYIYNNIVCKCVNKGIGYRSNYSNGNLIVKNNLCQGNGTDYAFPAQFDTHAYNVSEDSSSPDGATYQRDVHDAFYDYAGDNFKLDPDGDSGDLAVLDDGENLYAYVPDDIIGQARDDGIPFWIGASHIVAGGETHSLKGMASAIASAIATAVALRTLSGSISGVSGASGILSRGLSLKGSAAGISSAAGLLSISGEIGLAGIIEAVSGINGNLIAERLLSGNIAGVSDITGALAVSAVAEVLLKGSIDSISSVTGILNKLIGLSGGVDSQTTIAGNLLLTRALKGAIQAQASVDANMQLLIQLAGSIDAAASIIASLTIAGEGIGEIIDPQISSLTTIREIKSITVPREILSMTIKHLIESK